MPSIGETLREARMRQRLDIADVEARTKIRAKYLRALENEEFAILPGPTYVKTFLRTYAELLGLDPHLLVEEYRAGWEPHDDLELQGLNPPGIGRERRQRRPSAPLTIAVLGVLAVIAFLAFLGRNPDGDGDGDGGEQAAQSATETGSEPSRRPPQRERRRPTSVRLRVIPVTPTYVCVDRGAGTDVVFEDTLAEAQTFRGRRLRVNLGKTSIELLANGKPVEVPPGPNPVGFEFTPTATEPLPVGERPCA